MEPIDWMTVAVGQDLPPLVKPPITKVQLVKYAGASGDFNPIHTDDEVARSVGLPGVIAHGMLSMGFLGQYASALAGSAGFVRQLRVRFHGMVRPGDVLTCRARVIARDEQARMVRLAISAEHVEGKPVTAGEAELAWREATA
jgi:acyl dehydratase